MLEHFITFLVMVPNVVARALCIAIIIRMLKIFGFVTMIIIAMSQLIIEYWITTKSKGKLTNKVFLGVLTSFTSPCLIVKESSKHLLFNGITGSVLYSSTIWILYTFTLNFGPPLPGKSPFECHFNITTNSIMKCGLNASTAFDCHYGFLSNMNQSHFMICPEGYNQWHLLWIACLVVTLIMALSLVSIGILHHLIHVEKRMVWFKKIGFDSCPKHDASIKQFIFDIMEEEKDFNEVNKRAIENTGKPLLELFVISKRFHISKVSI